jgi:hypothetical protein
MDKRLTLLVLGSVFLGGLEIVSAQQAEVGLRLDVDQRQVAVGDRLNVTVEFKQVGTGVNVIQQPSIPSLEHFEIVGTSSATQVSMVNQKTAVISSTKLTLVATKAGDETIGPALLIYQDPQLGKREIKSNLATVTVVEKSGFSIFGGKKKPNLPAAAPNPPPAPDDGLKDLKPLLIDSLSRVLLRVFVWLAVFGLAMYLIWRFLIRRKPGGSPTFPGAEDRLREAWKKLAKEELTAKEFCLGLSSLIRECLQYRFQFPAVDYTTEEILRAVSKVKLTEDEKTATEKCLKACDRVLYADGNLTGRDNLRSLCSALLPKARKN